MFKNEIDEDKRIELANYLKQYKRRQEIGA